MNTRRLKIFSGMLAILLSILACGPRPPVVETTPTALPIQQPQNQPQTQPQRGGSTEPTPGKLNSDQRSALASATVRILGVRKASGKTTPIYNGSGTIISPDGIILTNAHVASPASVGQPDAEPDALIVELLDREDRPPVSTYLASILALDSTLDLAVIRADRTLNGSPVSSASLKLPYVPLGDSDAVKLGDDLYIFGFPSIGGETITFTSGAVSGFDTQNKVGERAWFKTDAAISGGNSGGQASNSKGELIGVPSRLGTSSAMKMTDCRRIADTNGDGKIDEKDTCIPAGGFINAIRPVKWAQPLLQAARTGATYTSPYGPPVYPIGYKEGQQQPPQQTGGSPQFTLVGWSNAVDDNYCPVNKLQSFPTGSSMLYAVFQWSNMPKGTQFGFRWLQGGQEIASKQQNWDLGTSGNCFYINLNNNNKALSDGEYRLELYAGANLSLVTAASVKVGGSATQPPQTQGKAGFTLVSWASATDANNCPTDSVQGYPSGATAVYAVFKWTGLNKGTKVSYRWMVDNREVFSNSLDWDLATSGNCFAYKLANNGKALPNGKYLLEIYVGDTQTLNASANNSVGGTGQQTQSSTVQVKGSVTDANTGKAIAGVLVVILKPGIEPSVWLEDGNDDDILDAVETDANGAYSFTEKFSRGVKYGMLAGSKKLGYRTVTGYVDVKANDPDVLNIKIQLSK